VRTLCANVGRAASNNTADGRRQRGAPAVNYLTMVLGFSFGAFELDAVRLLFADDAPRLYGAEVALSVGHCIPRTLLEVCVSGGLSGQGAMDFAAALRRGACPKLQKLVRPAGPALTLFPSRPPSPGCHFFHPNLLLTCALARSCTTTAWAPPPRASWGPPWAPALCPSSRS
jgi:hypothetical protein